MNTTDLLTQAEAARTVGRHRQSLHRAISRGHVPTVEIAGIPLVRLRDVRKWAALGQNLQPNQKKTSSQLATA